MVNLRRYTPLAILLLAAGCSSQAEPQRAVNPNRYIYVTGESLSEQCYRDLGPVNVTEPFARATVESGDSTMADRLRALALKQYPRDADAVIGVHADDNDAGTATTVSGEAVEVLDHTTVTCTLREMPPVVDAAALTAAGGIFGAAVGGLSSGTPQGAETWGYLGAAAVGADKVLEHRQNVDQQMQSTYDTLLQQRETIASLQDERSRLNECKEEETPLEQCGKTQPASNQAPPDKSDEPDWSASQFDLEKQMQMQQDYIAKLQGQIGDLKQEMQSK